MRVSVDANRRGEGLWPYRGAVNHFAGAARWYAEFRPGYPEAIWRLLAAEAPLDQSARVLDLGAGPGTATLPLARWAGSVVAVEEDREMVAEGRRLAELAGIGNVEWVNSAAEDIAFPDGSFRLIVIASAFHWMDRVRVAVACRRMLDRGGLLAIVNNPTPLMELRAGSALGAAIAEVQARWFSDEYYVLDVAKLDPPEVVLSDCGFRGVTVSYEPQVQAWDVERFLGFLRSTSSRPDQRLGDRFPQFAADMDRAIRAVVASGQWTLDAPVQLITGRLSGQHLS